MAGTVLAASAWTPAHAAESCSGPGDLTAQMSMQPAALPVHTDFSAAELRAMAPGNHRHDPLGFYRDTVGYRLAVNVRKARGGVCSALVVDAQIVEARREIQIASDLLDSPCLRRIAIQHYRRHAEAADQALQDMAHGLPTTLRDNALRIMRVRDGSVPLKARIETELGSVLDAAVAAFSKSALAIRDAVDAQSEFQKLIKGCGSV